MTTLCLWFHCLPGQFFWPDGSWVKGIILRHFYFLHLFARALLHALKLVVVGGPCDFSVSPWSKSFFFPFLGDFYSTWGSVGTRAWTWTWTRAWQLIIFESQDLTLSTASLVDLFCFLKKNLSSIFVFDFNQSLPIGSFVQNCLFASPGPSLV